MSAFARETPKKTGLGMVNQKAGVHSGMTESRKSSPAGRRTRAVESFRTAAECIGPVGPGMSVFAVTRGQFSMLDAVLHVLDGVGPARLSIWTWTIADYEIQAFTALAKDDRIRGGRLVIDGGARGKNAPLISDWQRTFGPDSVRYVLNHAKIATIEGGGLRVLLRGSMNLNFNPRFEQLDVTEGGEDFDLVRRIEEELPVLADACAGSDVYRASRVAEAFEPEKLSVFATVKRWAK